MTAMAIPSFLSEFSPVSTEAWEQAIREDLKGAAYAEKLIWRSPEGFSVKPFYRAEDLAGIDHRLQPAALLGGALDRHQKRQQALAVFRAGIFLQGLAER